MARPSKLTEKQWDEVVRRNLAGESISKLAAEFGVARSAMSEKISDRTNKIKAVANQMVAAEREFKAMPVSDRAHVITVRDRLSVLMDVYLQTAETAARNAMHMHNLAAEQKQYIDDASPHGSKASRGAVTSFMSLTMAGNAAMVIPSTILKAGLEIQKEGKTDGETDFIVEGGLPEGLPG